ncbi:hypothetical protein BGZ72_008582, partial [Mortierella alpina]
MGEGDWQLKPAAMQVDQFAANAPHEPMFHSTDGIFDILCTAAAEILKGGEAVLESSRGDINRRMVDMGE